MWLRTTIILMVFAAVNTYAQATISTGKQVTNRAGMENGVTVHTYKGTGLVHYQIYPGISTSPFLSFKEKSFLTVKIDDAVYTNNDVGYAYPYNFSGLMNGAVNKYADTVVCIWSYRSGCNIIQEVFPVKLDYSVQIVTRWKVKNTSTSSKIVSMQYLHDIFINGNDAAPILTSTEYTPMWRQYNASSMPVYYVSMERALPNPPTFNTGLTGFGYTDTSQFTFGPKNIKRLTIGNWNQLVTEPLGAPSPLPSGQFNDGALLYEFNTDTIPAGTEREIGRISYGTSQYLQCKGELFGISFSPDKVIFDINDTKPVNFKIEMTIFNPDIKKSSENTAMTLIVGDHIKIIEPQPVLQNGKSQKQSVGTQGKIPPYGVGTVSWTLQVDPKNIKTNEVSTWLGFIAEAPSLGYPIFVNDKTGTDTCQYGFTLQLLPKRFDEFDPLITSSVKNDEFSVDVIVSDNRQYDSGLSKVEWSVISGDSANFHVNVTPPISGCSKAQHTITISRESSTKGGCGELRIIDCFGHMVDTTICFNAVPQWYPDTLAPRSRDTMILRTRAVIYANDNAPIDTGINSVSLLGATVSPVTVTYIPTVLNCDKNQVIITVSAPDTIGAGCAYIGITDCANNTTIDTICFAPLMSAPYENNTLDLDLIGNPAATMTTVRIRSSEPMKFGISIVDLGGKSVYSLPELMTHSPVTDIPLDLKLLASGTYYVILTTPTHQLARSLKVIK